MSIMTAPVDLASNAAHKTAATHSGFHVLAKPTGPKCNLQCEYCFYKEKEDGIFLQAHQANSLNMEEALLERYIQEYIQSQYSIGQREINFLWQGGEPMMRGLNFYRLAVSLQREHCPQGVSIHNHFQTNGILINEKWAQFFAAEDFLIGISIDGPQFIHDMYRKTLKGGGSYHKVVAGLNWLKQYDVPFNTMTVIGRHNEMLGAEVYLSLRALGATSMQFIPLVERFDQGQTLAGPKQDAEQQRYNLTPWSVSREGYATFIKAVFDQWLKRDVGKVSVQLFDVLLEIWLGKASSLCIHRKNCGSGVVMEHNGDVYSCDHFVYPEYKLGNAYQDNLVAMVSSVQQQAFGDAKYDELPEQCKRCDYIKACYGGCPKHRFTETASGEPKLNYLCSAYLQIYDHLGPWIHRMAQLVRSGYPASLVMQRGDNAKPAASRNAPCPCGSNKKYKRCCA